MNRPCAHLSLALAAFLIAGCSGLFGNDGSTENVGIDCARDLNALNDLLIHERSCSSDDACPAGSYCSQDGRCEWDCYAKSDCGVGGVACNCRGRCVLAGQDPPSEVACPRSVELLQALTPGTRACFFDNECPLQMYCEGEVLGRCGMMGACTSDADCPAGTLCQGARAGRCHGVRTCMLTEDCPFGSDCDKTSARCKFSCLSTDHPTAGCPTGKVCDCLGECVAPSAAPEAVPAQVFRLEVAPDMIFVQGTTWPGQEFFAKLITEDASLAGDRTRHPVVNLLAQAGITLQLLNAAGMVVASGAEIQITSWTFAARGGEHVASWKVVALPTTSIVPADEPWQITITAAGVANGRQIVLLGSEPRPSGYTPPGTAGEYVGEVILEANATPGSPACAVGSRPERFSRDMVGCSGNVAFANRPSLCAPGWSPCTASKWVQRRGGKAPALHYWTADDLRWSGTSQSCSVSTTTGGSCGTGSSMRVCAGLNDALGNQCVWRDCGYEATTPNQYFGGCGNTAGTLCCRDSLPATSARVPISEANQTRFRVRAWASDSQVVLFDDARVLSPTGVIAFPTAAGSVAHFPWLSSSWAAPNGPATADTLVARVAIRNAHTRNADGTLSGGRFAVTLPTSPPRDLVFRYELSWQGNFSATACTTDSACAAGEHCETGIGRCAPGRNWRGGTDVINRVAHRQIRDWAAAGRWLEDDDIFRGALDTAIWVESLLCKDPQDPIFNTNKIISLPFAFRTIADQSLGHHTGWPFSAILPFSGDIACADKRPPHHVGLGIARDHSTRFAPAWSTDAGALLASCLTELDRHRPPHVPSGSLDVKRSAFFAGDYACASLARLAPAFQMLAAGTLSTGGKTGVDDYRARLLQRLAFQWLQLHTFVARQSREETKLDGVIAGADVDVRLGELLARLERGSDLFLDEAYGEKLAGLTRAVLTKPDYRMPYPVAYWTLDENDMQGDWVLDAAGDNHFRLTAPYNRPTDANRRQGIETNQTVSLHKGSLALHGNMTVSFWMQVSSLAVGSYPVLEYGDADNLLHRIGIVSRADGAGGTTLHLFAEHGPRSAPKRVTSDTLVPGELIQAVVKRKEIDGTHWGYDFRVSRPPRYDDLSYFYFELVQNPPPAFLGEGEAGKLAFRGFMDDIAIWSQDMPMQDRNYVRPRNTPTRDNTMLEPFWTVDTEDHPHDLGLELAVLETASEYLRTLDAYLEERFWNSHYDCYLGVGLPNSPQRQDDLARMGRGLRYALALESFADNLHERAGTIGCLSNEICTPHGATCGAVGDDRVCQIAGEPVRVELGWQDRVAKAKGELASLRQVVLQTGNKIKECRNPIGIRDDVLPLFFGDVAGNSSRYFAASDYLMEKWAEPAVKQAVASLEAARTSWVSKRQSEIQQILTDQERARRLEQIELTYANQIIELCGLQDMNAFQVLDAFHTRLSPNSCYRRCAPGSRDASCYRGKMGAAALAVIGASDDIEIAESHAEDLQGRYDTQSKFCTEKEVRLSGDVNELDKYKNRMKWLRRGRKLWGFGMQVAKSIALAAIGDVSGAIQTAPDYIDAIAGEAMDTIEANFQANMQKRSIEEQINQCHHEADMHKFGIDTANKTIRRKFIDLQLAYLQLEEERATVSHLVREGTAAVAREARRTVPSIAFHYWLDEKVERFRKDFDWARRLTYLATMATEYEFQQSLPLRKTILSAHNPDQLLEVIRALHVERAARTVNGRRPEDSQVVLSLRYDVLRMSDRGDDLEPGERTWDDARRFSERLHDPEFAVYSPDGIYLGQGIPFTLKERGALELRCGERLWRVGATIQGDLLTVDAPGAPMVLMKRNTFLSQWCHGKGDGKDYQVGAVDPTALLFHPSADPSGETRTDAYTAALLFPWFNVPRSEFYREAYVEGSSEELSGRGLYGDYLLLFPEAGLLNWTRPEAGRDRRRRRFPLERVEDVLLRFDYLSVDNISRR